jgi:acyl dehydratase
MQYFEDFTAGQKFASGRLTVSAAEIKEFAASYDPQPFHLDETPGKTASLAGSRPAAGTRRR